VTLKKLRIGKPSARLAVLVGKPNEPGPYVIRVKAAAGTRLMPHRRPEDRVYTVISGVFYIGLGQTFDGDKMKAYPPGAVAPTSFFERRLAVAPACRQPLGQGSEPGRVVC
jgi:hypothetical protein